MSRGSVAQPPSHQYWLGMMRSGCGNPLWERRIRQCSPSIVRAASLGQIVAALKRDGLTVVLSEQNLRFASALADRGAIIEKGVIRHVGEMSDIAHDESLRARYLALGG